MTDRPDRRPYRQCQAIVPAQINRGVPWTTEHRCRHPAGLDGYCWQHRPAERTGADATPETEGS
jgi:hypothetical protein